MVVTDKVLLNHIRVFSEVLGFCCVVNAVVDRGFLFVCFKKNKPLALALKLLDYSSWLLSREVKDYRTGKLNFCH